MTAQTRCVSECARTTDPDGNQLEIYYGRVQHHGRFNSPQGVSGFVTGNMGLGHIVLPAPNLSKCLEFYTLLMGFQQTDFLSFFYKSTSLH